MSKEIALHDGGTENTEYLFKMSKKWIWKIFLFQKILRMTYDFQK